MKIVSAPRTWPYILLINALVSLASAQVPNLPARHGGLYLKEGQIPRGYRVIGVEIHLAQGRFESIDDIPAGWRAVIDNEPSWKATFMVSANAGAAPLDEKAIQKIWIQIAQTEAEDNITNVWGWLNLISDSNVGKRVGLSGSSFEFIERYGRHRLR